MRRWIRFFSTAIVTERLSSATHSVSDALIEYVAERSGGATLVIPTGQIRGLQMLIASQLCPPPSVPPPEEKPRTMAGSNKATNIDLGSSLLQRCHDLALNAVDSS